MTYDTRNPFNAAGVCQLRLTLESTVPVSTTNQTGKTTIYLTPFVGNAIGLKVGGVWRVFNTAEVSKGLGTLTSGKPYDVFAYWDGSAVQLEFSQAWTGDNTRNDTITRDAGGVWVKNADSTRLLVGTFYTTATTTTEDSDTKRYVSNVFNTVDRFLSAIETNNSWTYTTATVRAYNGGGTPLTILNFVRSLNEDVIEAVGLGISSNSATTGGVAVAAGIGLDSTTTNSAQLRGGLPNEDTGIQIPCYYVDAPTLGKHTLNLLEWSTASGTTTWYGDNGGTIVQAGIHAFVRV